MEIKMNMRLRSRKVNMALDDIKIPMRMAMTPPKPDRQIRHAEMQDIPARMETKNENYQG